MIGKSDVKAPFMDVTFQDTPMQVKHLYHGQHTVDGVEITPHSPYWTTDLALALGHALFGAEQEVTGADLLICALCDGTHFTSKVICVTVAMKTVMCYKKLLPMKYFPKLHRLC